MSTENTQLPVTETMRDRLRFLKVMTGCNSYTETLDMLLDDCGYEVPEQAFDPETAKDALRGMSDVE